MITPILAVLEISDYATIGVIVLILVGGASLASRPDNHALRLERQMRNLQRKLDLLLHHHGIQMPTPSGLSPELEALARNPSQKIAAIKLYREEHPAVGLAEAKKIIEDFYDSGR